MIREAIVEGGKVRGIPAADPRITAFKGIPFAAPPVGKNRWRAPQPVEGWEGERDCSRFAPISMQSTPGLGTDIYCREWHVDPEIPMSEDCLYLNVWTGAKKDEKQPVFVWFFGGALQWGYPAEMEFDGERLARRGIIVVTVNYRINAFGFLAHPEITKENPEAPANFGNLDQLAGINWVRKNIEAFGGDPENITIAGQSAGGGSVLSQMASPKSMGKFQKAVIMSAMIYDPFKKRGIGTPATLEEAEKTGEAFFDYLGVKNLEEARALDAFLIRDKYYEFMQDHGMMMTVLDHKFCVGEPLRMMAEGKCAKIPVISGNTEEEFLSEVPEGKWKGEKFSGIECTTKSEFQLLEKYENAQNGYYYRFACDIPGWDHPGTFHSVDLWFFFETLAKCWRPFVGRHYDLARQMSNYLANFVKTGDPNGKDADGSEMPKWQPYRKEDPQEMVFTSEGSVPKKEEQTELLDMLLEKTKESLTC